MSGSVKPVPEDLSKTEEMVVLKCLVCGRFSYQTGPTTHPWHRLEEGDDFPQAKKVVCPDCDYSVNPPSDQFPVILF